MGMMRSIQMSEFAVVLDNLTRDFDTVRAVDGLSLKVPAGEVYGFLGPNGAGKTTTINLLLGLLIPTAGRVEVLGMSPQSSAEEIRARSGALLEHTGIYEQLTAEDNLEFYARANRIPDGERQARIRELLGAMDLWDRRKERAGKWSRGMKQKLALARALLHRPRLVLLDEPTAGLDVMAARAIREDLAALAAREGVTVFLTTHNMSEAEALCSQVAVIRSGRLVAAGHPDELRARAGRPRLEIVGRNLNSQARELLEAQPTVAGVDASNGRWIVELRGQVDTSALVNLMIEAGVLVEEVRRGKASLEEVFVTLMEETR
jgi:ABC-2 type transport system ATP-binding protein